MVNKIDWKNPIEVREYKKKYNRGYVKKKLIENPNWYRERYQRKKEYMKKYRKNNKDYYKREARKYRNKYPEKTKAHDKVRNKIKIPNKQICKICNSNLAVIKHHPDYTKPFKVLFVCRKCHSEIHTNERRSTQ